MADLKRVGVSGLPAEKGDGRDFYSAKDCRDSTATRVDSGWRLCLADGPKIPYKGKSIDDDMPDCPGPHVVLWYEFPLDSRSSGDAESRA